MRLKTDQHEPQLTDLSIMYNVLENKSDKQDKNKSTLLMPNYSGRLYVQGGYNQRSA